jgi:hypothetical protein
VVATRTIVPPMCVPPSKPSTAKIMSQENKKMYYWLRQDVPVLRGGITILWTNFIRGDTVTTFN